jgi:hypothetical protein
MIARSFPNKKRLPEIVNCVRNMKSNKIGTPRKNKFRNILAKLLWALKIVQRIKKLLVQIQARL